MAARIYVASSWRNEHQPRLVKLLRSHGAEVYDFRNPSEGDHGFHWSEVDPEWKDWDPHRYRTALFTSPIAASGFYKDKTALDWATAGLLVLPSGRSAHLEAGYLIGQGKPVAIYLNEGEPIEPELMYLLGWSVILNDEGVGLWAMRLPRGI